MRTSTILKLLLLVIVLCAITLVVQGGREHLVAWLCAIAGLALVGAVFAWPIGRILETRRRTRHLKRRLECRCVGCGYDRRGIAADRCPECGRHWALEDEEVGA